MFLVLWLLRRLLFLSCVCPLPLIDGGPGGPKFGAAFGRRGRALLGMVFDQ